MKFPMCFSELRIRNVGIDLRRRDRGMPEKLLDDTHIRSIREESRRKAMAEGMCWDMFQDSCLQSIVFYHIRDKETREAHMLIIELTRSHIFFSEIVSYKERMECIVSSSKIYFYFFFRLRCEIDDTEFISFSSYGELECLEIHIISIKMCQLRDTESRRVDTLHDRDIPFPLYALMVHWCE